MTMGAILKPERKMVGLRRGVDGGAWGSCRQGGGRTCELGRTNDARTRLDSLSSKTLYRFSVDEIRCTVTIRLTSYKLLDVIEEQVN
jgi:hypothetical protein